MPMAIDQLPPDFYATRDFTDKMIEFLDSNDGETMCPWLSISCLRTSMRPGTSIEFLKSNDGETPWFAYVPYTAPHWPLQGPEDWLDRHAGPDSGATTFCANSGWPRPGGSGTFDGHGRVFDMSVGRLTSYLEESAGNYNGRDIFNGSSGGSSSDVGLVESI